jgi:hypothetical protein
VSLLCCRRVDRRGGEEPDPQAEALREKQSFSDLTVWETATGQQTAYVPLTVDWTKGNGI